MIQEHTKIDATDGAAATISARSVFVHALLFVLGFSLIFVVGWGGAATVMGQLFGQYKSILAQIGGVVVILFGLHTIGLLQIPWLYYDLRPQWSYSHKGGFLSSGLMGIFFAAGWTPCIGITLGAILTLGLSQQSTGQAMVLASGFLLVLIGLMLLTQQMIWIAIWAQRNGLFLDLSLGGTVPTYPVAILAGLISFLSPCVLPLVPAYLGYLSGQAVRQS